MLLLFWTLVSNGHILKKYDKRSAARARNTFQLLWDEHYKSNVINASKIYEEEEHDIASSTSTLVRKAIKQQLNKASTHDTTAVKRRGRWEENTVHLYKYQRWCEEPIKEEKDVPDFIVQQCAQKGTYPQLAKIALEILSIPGMSVEVERIFSRLVTLFHLCSMCSATNIWIASGRRLITDQTAQMKEHIIEECICLRRWEVVRLVNIMN